MFQTDTRLNAAIPGADATLYIPSNRYGSRPNTSYFHRSQLDAVRAYWEGRNRVLVTEPKPAELRGYPEHLQVDVEYRPF